MLHRRDRLPSEKRRIYDQSAAISHVPLSPSTKLLRATAALPQALKQQDGLSVEELSQKIVDEI